MKTWRTVHAVVIEQRQRRIPEFCGSFNERFRE